jgi:hypothetical protein
MARARGQDGRREETKTIFGSKILKKKTKRKTKKEL